jgi:hypothetical protein
MGDLATVVETLNPANASKLPVTWEARRNAIAFLGANPVASRVNVIVLRADSDERWLISIGRRGGWRKLWNFGNGRA